MLDDNAYNLTTKDGKMYAIPKPPNPATFSLMIRKDWLDNLNLDIPETADELLEVIRQFTFNDPDQNGEDDTWGISSAGGGSGIGEITWLLGMYGQYQGFFVEDNEVHTSLTNGTHKNFLDFMRILVDEKLIDPDWYTQSWEQRKPKQFTDKIGMLWYPGVIVAEHEELIGNTGERVDVWESIPVPKANENGGLNPAEGLTSGGYAISKQAGEDKEKLAKILEILEGVTYPNDGYWAMRWGVGSDGQEFMELDNDFKFYTEINDNYRKEFPGAWDYGHWVDNKRDKVLQSSESEPGAVALKQIELDTKSANFPKPTNYSDLLRLDVQKLSEVSRIVEEFEIKYILGDEDDYDSFVQNWMNQGGEELMKSAEEQFREMGIIN